jgi:hypothetical protein
VPRATARDHVACRRLDREHVGRVDFDDRQAEGGEARRDVPGQVEAARRALRPAVVLEHDQQRQLPERRHVERLVHDPLAQRAVAEEDDAQAVGSPELLGERDAGGRGHDPALDPVGLEAGCADVLAAADPRAKSRGLPHDLRQETEGVARPREVVPVAAVVGEQVVPLAEVLHQADRVGFLADAGMRRAAQEPRFEQREHRLLEAADEAHAPVEPDVPRLRERSRGPLADPPVDRLH